MPGVKEEGAEEDARLLGAQISANLQSTPLSHHDGKGSGQGWSLKRSRGRAGKTEGGRKGEGGSDSDSDSDSGSSSSERSGSSDDSGESEEEVEGGKLVVQEKNVKSCKNNDDKLNYFPFSFKGAMKLCDVDEDNSLLSMSQSQDGIPPPDPLRVDWPKVNNVQLSVNLICLGVIFVFILC